MKEISSYKKVHPRLHLVILKDEELKEVRRISKEYHAHLPENNTNRVILSLSVSSEEAGALRCVAARQGKTLSSWLRAAAIDKAYFDELAEFKPADGISTEQRAGDLLAYFLG